MVATEPFAQAPWIPLWKAEMPVIRGEGKLSEHFTLPQSGAFQSVERLKRTGDARPPGRYAPIGDRFRRRRIEKKDK